MKRRRLGEEHYTLCVSPLHAGLRRTPLGLFLRGFSSQLVPLDGLPNPHFHADGNWDSTLFTTDRRQECPFRHN